MSRRALLDSSAPDARGAGNVPSLQRWYFSVAPALLALACFTGCADEPADGGGFTTPDGGFPSTTYDSGVTGGGLTAGMAGNGSLGGTGTGVFGGNFAGTGGAAGTTGGGGTAAGAVTGGGTGGIIAGLGGALGGTAGTGGIIGGLLGGSGGATAGLIGGIGGTTGGGGEPIDPSVTQPAASKLPTVSGACPDFRNGSTANVAGINVKFWSGAAGGQKGALVFYWHGTGGSSDEADALFGFGTGGLSGVIDDITGSGGIVASPDNSTGTGNSIDTIVWTTDDFKAADQIVACAIQANRIDPGRIHALGFSAGGLAAGTMYYLRSNYLASVVTYSGGTSPWPGNDIRQDPNNKLPAMLFHGGDGDWVIVGFKDQSIQMATEMKGKGAMAIMCDHGGGHAIPSDGPAAAWAFFKAHPYNVNPEPWSGSLPSSVPRYCVKY